MIKIPKGVSSRLFFLDVKMIKGQKIFEFLERIYERFFFKYPLTFPGL